MVNVNVMIDDMLRKLKDVNVVCYHPEAFNKLPVVSYYELTTTTGLCYDNAEQGQRSHVSVDVWANSVGECGEISVEVDRLMQKEGWHRDMSRDMPPENKVYHKAMRYYKHIFFK